MQRIDISMGLVAVMVATAFACDSRGESSMTRTPAQTPAAAQSACRPADALQVARLLVTDPRLSAYFHLDRADRKGVRLRDRAAVLGLTQAVDLAPRITASAGEDAVPPGWIELSLDRAECADRRIALHWRLPAEGLAGSAEASGADGHWVLDQLSLAER
jgi:hypothetical protein